MSVTMSMNAPSAQRKKVSVPIARANENALSAKAPGCGKPLLMTLEMTKSGKRSIPEGVPIAAERVPAIIAAAREPAGHVMGPGVLSHGISFQKRDGSTRQTGTT